jgi:tight adherence protein B
LTETAILAVAIKAGLSTAQLRERYQPNAAAAELIALCERVGAPLAENLHRLAEVEVQRANVFADLQVAASGPRASARLVTFLPIVVLLGGQLLGLKVFSCAPAISYWSIGIGIMLLVFARTWTNKVLSRAEPSSDDPGKAFDMFACCLGAGLPPGEALAQLPQPDNPELQELITEASATGLAVARLARATADEARLRWRVAADQQVRSASVRILWPLGLLVLPAFVLIAILPLGLAIIKG